MRRFFRNIPWRNVLIITLTVALGIGAIAGVASIANKNTKTISATYFKRGAIDSNGFYIESDTSIYTKDLIECRGLEIAPAFESTGTYQVFYYGSDKQFIDATEVMNSQSDSLYVKGDNFEVAKYCRIMITPETPKDDDGFVVEDYKIKFYEVSSIASKYTITVSKNQGNSYSSNLMKVKGYGLYENGGFTALEEGNKQNGFLFSENIDISDYGSVLIIMPKAIFTNEKTNITLIGNTYETVDLSLVNKTEENGNVIIKIENVSDFEFIRLHTDYDFSEKEFAKVSLYATK